MEFNFIEKFAHLYDRDGKEKKSFRGENEKMNRNFHLDCKYSKKKICSCKQNENFQNDKDFSEFLISLINNKIDFKVDSNDPDRKINFVKKESQSEEFIEAKKYIDVERLKNIEYPKTKYFMRNSEEVKLLSIADYKEIEKSINDDKKICENCKTNIYENNYHKGWKNELGDYVLLCPLCSKKYFNGALEIKFDSFSRKEDMIPVNRSISINSSQIMIKQDAPNSAPTMINTSRPVEDHLLSIKRNSELSSDLICANRRCNKIGKRNDFLCCFKCEKYYHASCTDPQLVMRFANRFKWLCSHCKVCVVCNTSDLTRLVRCATCDRAFHEKCYSLTTSSMNGKSYCTDCISCKNCFKALPLLSILNQNEFVSIKGHRVCDECWKYYKNKHYCPKCLKIYKQENEIQNYKIYCNKCLNWYHGECEGLSIDDVKENNRSKYTCSICKSC